MIRKSKCTINKTRHFYRHHKNETVFQKKTRAGNTATVIETAQLRLSLQMQFVRHNYELPACNGLQLNHRPLSMIFASDRSPAGCD